MGEELLKGFEEEENLIDNLFLSLPHVSFLILKFKSIFSFLDSHSPMKGNYEIPEFLM